MSKSVRTFVAIRLPDELQKHITELTELSYFKQNGFRVIKPENAHITLKFLGDIEISELPLISSALEDAVVGMQPHEISLTGAYAFPHHLNASIYWIRPGNEVDKIYQVRSNLLRELSVYFEDETELEDNFVPHITIAKYKSGNLSAEYRKELVDCLRKEVEWRRLSWVVESIELIQSDKAASYNTLLEIPLGQ